MAYDERELEILNLEIARVMEELEEEDLLADARQPLEVRLTALVDMRLAIEREANQTASPPPME